MSVRRSLSLPAALTPTMLTRVSRPMNAARTPVCQAGSRGTREVR